MGRVIRLYINSLPSEFELPTATWPLLHVIIDLHLRAARHSRRVSGGVVSGLRNAKCPVSHLRNAKCPGRTELGPLSVQRSLRYCFAQLQRSSVRTRCSRNDQNVRGPPRHTEQCSPTQHQHLQDDSRPDRLRHPLTYNRLGRC